MASDRCIPDLPAEGHDRQQKGREDAVAGHENGRSS